MHWMFSGLIEQNIARTQHLPTNRHVAENPTHQRPRTDLGPPPDLVDFQLSKIHLLTADHCGNDYFEQWVPPTREKFTAETLAYGKIGMWKAFTRRRERETQAMSCRTYYIYHCAQNRYRGVAPEEILYHDGQRLVGATDIVLQKRERLGRVYVRYANGCESWVNLNGRQSWTIAVDGKQHILPSYGWYQRRKEGWGKFLNCSSVVPGEARRLRIQDEGVLLVGAPGSVVCWDDIETDGTVLVLRESSGGYRVVNVDGYTVRTKAACLGVHSAAKQVVLHVFDLEGDAVGDEVRPIEEGWIDLSLLAHEQFALMGKATVGSGIPRR